MKAQLNLRRLSLVCIIAFCMSSTLCFQSTAAAPATQPENRPVFKLLSVNKIWDRAPHNAFTDLIRYRDQFICCFREAPKHDGGVSDSHLRLLSSKDGQVWEDVGSLSDPRGDIRDAKLSIAPDGRLMVLSAIQLFDAAKGKHQSLVFFTSDLKQWDGPHDVGEANYWLWGIHWHNSVGYTIGYNSVGGYKAKLYTTKDGVNFAPVEDAVMPPQANESAIAFVGDTAWCLLRVFGPAMLGTAQPPYHEWTWTKLSEPVGGPELIDLPNGQLLGAGRRYLPGKTWKTSLLWIDSSTGKIDEALQFPSGGDTSYPGMVLHEGVLYVSYYSSHEGKTSIYLARVAIE